MHVVSASTLSEDQLPAGALQDGSRPTQDQLHLLVHAVQKAKRIAVVCGAGCSTGAGIPDFRSSTGLFKALKEKHPKAGLSSGKDLFNASLFQSEANTALYYSMIAQLSTMAQSAEPTAFHQFLKTLDDQGKLFRVYTQNIDALEAKAGLSFGLGPSRAAAAAAATASSSSAAKGKKRKLDDQQQDVQEKPPPRAAFKASIPRCVPLHGSLQTLSCRKCGHSEPLETPAHLSLLSQGQAVPCPACETAEEVRSVSNYRSRGVGIMKPSVVLYGEPHADADLVGSITASDLRGARPDLLLVVGTTLKVPGTQRLVSELAKVIHPSFTTAGGSDDRPIEKQLTQPKTIFLNSEFPTQAKKWGSLFDVWVQSDIQEFSKLVSSTPVSKVKRAAGKKQQQQPPLGMGISQMFNSTKPSTALKVQSAKPGAPAPARAPAKKAANAAPKKAARQPAAPSKKPGFDVILCQPHNVFDEQPVVEGQRASKKAARLSPDTEPFVQATLHVRSNTPHPASAPANKVGPPKKESVASSSRESSVSRTIGPEPEIPSSSPSSSSSIAADDSLDQSADSQILIEKALLNQQTPAAVSKQHMARLSAASTLASKSPSPSSSDFSTAENASALVQSSPLAASAQDSNLPALSSAAEPAETKQYKVSDWFGAARNEPRASSRLASKA